MGSIPHSTSWQVFKYAYGPYLDGIFTQSNFGVVTKLGMWLMPKAAGHNTVMVTCEDDDQFGAAVEAIRPLCINGTIPNVGVIANANIGVTALKCRDQIFTGQGAVPLPLILNEVRQIGLGAWNAFFTLRDREADCTELGDRH
jgi:4-cresol dehydrogenase (hydroxylating)